MLIDHDFDERCRELFAAFPSNAPDVVVDQNWGDYSDAKNAFAEHGSNWSCNAIFRKRSVITFVNNAAFVFLLPRFVRCSLTEYGFDVDVLDYLVFGLHDKTAEYTTLFNPRQRTALLRALRVLFTRAEDELGRSAVISDKMKVILAALEAIVVVPPDNAIRIDIRGKNASREDETTNR